MNRGPAVLLLLGALLAGFGWWGLKSAAGRRMFDEMAGIVPLACLGAGGLLVVLGVSLAVLARFRS